MTQRIGILGVGAVGARTARQLLATNADLEIVLADTDTVRLEEVARTLGGNAAALTDGELTDQRIDLLIVAARCSRHLAPVRKAIAHGIPAISTSDRIEDVRAILSLDHEAKASGVAVLAGAGFGPGFSCVLASFVGERFDVVEEVHVAREGTGGPACARQHHRALSSRARDWKDGGWVRRPGGSGRELVWFPDPIGGADCYRAALPDAILLQPAFPDARRITARIAATRQDRFTSWLPMLSPPHPEGGVGAIRIEVRGRVAGAHVTAIAGAVARPAIASAAVAATGAGILLDANGPPPGVSGFARAMDSRQFLQETRRRGVTALEFAGLDDA